MADLNEENIAITFKQAKYQYYVVFCANLISLAHGAAIGWLSPSIKILQSEETPMASGPLTADQVSWIGAFLSLGAVFGNIAFGFCVRYISLKKSIYLLGPPNFLFWVSVLFGTQPWHLYLGRLCAGITGGGIYICVPLFVSEIADRRIRGLLGSLLMLVLVSGILFAFIAGSYVNYFIVPYIFILLPVGFMIGFFFFPHTPLNFLKMNKYEEAENSYIYYRLGNDRSGENTKKLVEIEMDTLKKILEMRKHEKETTNIWQILATKPAIKGILTGFCLTGLTLFSGTFAMINYTGEIFQASGSTLDANMSSIIVAAIQIVGVYVSTMLVDRLGRKLLLGISSVGGAISLAMLGTYSFLDAQQLEMTNFNWVPLMSFSLYVFITCIGILPLPFVVLAEILPAKIREVGLMICMISNSVFAFVSLKVFPLIIDEAGLWVAMAICCGVCILGVLFSVFILKETKGKNLQSVEEN